MTDQDPVLDPLQPSVSMAPAKQRSSNRMANMLLALAGVVAVAGIAFAGGRLTAPAASPTGDGAFNGFPRGSFNPGQFPGGGQSRPGGIGAGLGGGELRGTVTAVTDTSITLQLENGSSITVPVNSSTDYQSASQSTASGVTVGSSVVVQSTVTFTGGANPGASFDPTASGQPNLSFSPAQQVIVVAK